MTRKSIALLIGLAICLGMVLLFANYNMIYLAGLFGIIALIITSIYATEVDNAYMSPARKLRRYAKKHNIEKEVNDYLWACDSMGKTEEESVESAINYWQMK